jgi:putative colanic acid biosynthesis acetyltransferase WcaF
MTNSDPYKKPAMSLSNRLGRAIWDVVYILLFKHSPRPFHAWRSMLLRLFGAKIGPGCHIYPKAIIWAPWNLICEDSATIANGAIIYNPSLVSLGSHSIISQDAYLCGASHDYDDPAFPMIHKSIEIKRYAWVCARATVQMGVTIGEGAVLGLGAITSKDLEPWGVYAGIPAKKVKQRKHDPSNKAQ